MEFSDYPKSVEGEARIFRLRKRGRYEKSPQKAVVQDAIGLNLQVQRRKSFGVQRGGSQPLQNPFVKMQCTALIADLLLLFFSSFAEK